MTKSVRERRFAIATLVLIAFTILLPLPSGPGFSLKFIAALLAITGMVGFAYSADKAKHPKVPVLFYILSTAVLLAGIILMKLLILDPYIFPDQIA